MPDQYQSFFNFGDKRIFPNVFLSPMSGVTDLAFRRLVSKLAGGRTGLLVSEFVSVEGMTRLIPQVCKQMRFDEDQKPFMVQIFGSNPQSMARGAKMVEDSGADFIEINAGCPAPKIVKKSGGSGLLRNLSLYKDIISNVVKSVNIPVSVKVRLGFTEEEINIIETHKIAQEEGAQLFIIHGRTRSQGYKGVADWQYTSEVKQRSKIPIVGNGDIVTWQSAISRLKEYKLDGVSIGRGALHNPWIFSQVADAFEGLEPQDPSPKQQLEAYYIYKDFLCQEFTTETGVLGRLKQLSARLIKCLPNSAKWRGILLRSEDMDTFFKIINEFYQSLDENTAWGANKIKELNGGKDNTIEFGTQY